MLLESTNIFSVCVFYWNCTLMIELAVLFQSDESLKPISSIDMFTVCYSNGSGTLTQLPVKLYSNIGSCGSFIWKVAGRARSTLIRLVLLSPP